MQQKRYHVIFTGLLKPGMNADTVKANLILDIGLSEERADRLLGTPHITLKRYPTAIEAQWLARKLERIGILCRIEDHEPQSAGESGGESSLITLFSRFRPTTRRIRPAPVRNGTVKGSARKVGI